MGTNYYLQEKPCDTCKRIGKKLHLGKSSWGWQFHFRAHLDEEPPIKSFADWIERFNMETHEIVNEDNESISSPEFIEMVESKMEGTNYNDYIKGSGAWQEHVNWKDDSGNSFTEWEFS